MCILRPDEPRKLEFGGIITLTWLQDSEQWNIMIDLLIQNDRLFITLSGN